MDWKFDQAPDVACITCRAVMAGYPILVVTHYEDDHSWSFMDGTPIDMTATLMVAMSEVAVRHPDIDEISSLPPGWSATRVVVGGPWSKQQDNWDADL